MQYIVVKIEAKGSTKIFLKEKQWVGGKNRSKMIIFPPRLVLNFIFVAEKNRTEREKYKE